ncbi:MAG: CopZ family metallochaperone [Acidithiobacillus sp.]
MNEVILKVQGMTCGHCVMAVKKALGKVPGVTHVEVDLSAGKAVVQGGASVEAMIKAVTQAGYGADVKG